MDHGQFFQYLSNYIPCILDAILFDLQRTDLKALRQCSKSMSSLVLPYLFRGSDALFLSAHPPDLETLKAVMSNPDLSRRVQKIVWDDTTFNPRLLQRVNYNHDRPWQWDVKYDAAMIDSAFEFLCSFIREHVHIRSHRLDIQALTDALPHLPNLKSIKLTTLPFRPSELSRVWPALPPDTNSPTTRSFQSKSFKFYLLPPATRWHQNAQISDEQAKEMLSIDFVDFGKERPYLPETIPRPFAPFRGLLSVVRALTVNPTLRLEEFIIKPGSYHPYEHEGLSHWFWRYPSPEIDVLESAFKSLKRLTLSISGASNLGLERETWRRGHLTRAVRAARDLEYVHLDIANANPVHILFGDGTEKPPMQPLPHLSVATFMSAELHYDSLVRFVLGHSSTLQTLRIEASELHEATWREFIHAFKYGGVLRDARREDFELILEHITDDEDLWLPIQDVLAKFIRDETMQDPLVECETYTPPERLFD